MLRRKKPKPPEPGEDRINALADRLMEENRVDRLESELTNFDPAELSGVELESWHHLFGIAAFQQGDHPAAFERFKEGVRQCSDSGQMQFSLGQEYEFRAEPDEMFACFDRAFFPGITATYALAEARYAYLWGRPEKGMAYVEPIFSAYFELKILDSNFLYMRGLPFFEQTWAYLAAFSQLTGSFDSLVDLTKRAESECSDMDFDYVAAELVAIQSGDFSALKEKLISSIKDCKAGGFPVAYQSMRLNVLTSQETEDVNEAADLLEATKLGKDDFPWLEDMRILAGCELMHRSGNSEGESMLREEFLSRQPSLFEPDNAVNFNLLRYQELLTAEYRERTKAGGDSADTVLRRKGSALT